MKDCEVRRHDKPFNGLFDGKVLTPGSVVEQIGKSIG